MKIVWVHLQKIGSISKYVWNVGLFFSFKKSKKSEWLTLDFLAAQNKLSKQI